MQFVLQHRVQCLQWYITLVVSFASYPCNKHKTHVGRPKCERDTSSVRNVICKKPGFITTTLKLKLSYLKSSENINEREDWPQLNLISDPMKTWSAVA